MNPRVLIAAALLVTSVGARADWADPGAAYRCDVAARSFSVASVMDTSSPEDAGTVRAPPQFSSISSSRSVRCVFAGTRITARFRVRPPHETGICGGITQTSIEALHANGKGIFELPESFNHYCVEEQALHSIAIRKAGGATQIEICHAAWDWGVGYHNVRCETRAL